MNFAIWIQLISTIMLAFTFLLLSTLLCFFSNSWLIIWILLEINTIAFCSISTNSRESLINYLVIQSIASSILIVSWLLNANALLLLSLLINMGSIPFHSWFILVSNNAIWFNNNILFTWQNLIPVYLIIYLNNLLLYPFIIGSAILGSIFIINNKSFNEILALSSIFNLSWILCAISLSLNVLLLFSVLYWSSLIPFINDLLNMNSNTPLFINTINLAGIPPLILFTANWTTFSSILNTNLNVLSSLMLIISSINIFVYLRITTTFLLKPSVNTQQIEYNEALFLLANILILPLWA